MLTTHAPKSATSEAAAGEVVVGEGRARVGARPKKTVVAHPVDEVVGPKGKQDPDRSAVRHGHEAGEVTLGGRRVPVERPRVRAVEGSGEVALGTYRHFADRDPLTAVVLEQMLAGVSTRRFRRTREPLGQAVGSAERSTSKSAVSREFVGRTREHLIALMGRRLDDVRLAALMLDGIELKGRCCVVALGITTDGVKVPLGLWDGSTENTTVARHLLADLVDRGLDTEQGALVVLDGGKALRAAVREVLGPVPVHSVVRRGLSDPPRAAGRPPVMTGGGPRRGSILDRGQRSVWTVVDNSETPRVRPHRPGFQGWLEYRAQHRTSPRELQPPKGSVGLASRPAHAR